MGNRPEKHRCINCDGNYTATTKSCPDRKRIINRRNRSKSRNQLNRNGNDRNNANYQNRNNRSRSHSYNRNRSYSYNKNRRINAQKPDLREEIKQKKTARREYQKRKER